MGIVGDSVGRDCLTARNPEKSERKSERPEGLEIEGSLIRGRNNSNCE